MPDKFYEILSQTKEFMSLVLKIAFHSLSYNAEESDKQLWNSFFPKDLRGAI